MSRHANVTWEEKYDGLVLKSTIVSHVIIHLRLTLPASLMPSYWVKNRLTRQDVLTILEQLPSRDVWLLGLAIGASHLALSLFRTAHSSLGDIAITSKAVLMRKIVHKLQHLFIPHQHSMLNDAITSNHHIPPLPKHFLFRPDFDILAQDIMPQLNPFETLEMKQLFSFQNNQWIAVAFEGNSIFALRVMDAPQYKRARKYSERSGYASRSPVIRVKDKLYHIVLDDGVLFGCLAS